jgi:hypothetical protein
MVEHEHNVVEVPAGVGIAIFTETVAVRVGCWQSREGGDGLKMTIVVVRGAFCSRFLPLTPLAAVGT